MATFKIESTQPATYLDAGGRPVQGHLVRFTMTQWGEIGEINVPELDPDLVAERIQAHVAKRAKLDELSQSS